MKFFLSFCTILVFNQVLASSKNASILIIGTGPSGIAAATKLIENGFTNLVILEAEGRIGGRVNTIPFGKNNVDLGGQWCHGEKGNVVFEMANPLNLLEHSVNSQDDNVLLLSNGDVVDSDKGSKLFELGMSITEGNEIESYEGSVGNFTTHIYFEKLKEDKYNDISQDIAEKFLDFYGKYTSSYEAADTWDIISAKGNSAYEECEGDQLMNWKGKGYKTILEVMMKKIPNPSEDLKLEEYIKFNKTVTHIDWSDEAVKVTTSDDEHFTADHVIITVSLGVLKEKYPSLFTPSLTVHKENAINGLGFGTVDKIYLEFSEPFWNETLDTYNLLWNKEDIEEIHKRKDNWIEDLSIFSALEHQPNILCGWIHGVQARVMEFFSDEEVLESTMYLLRKFMNKITNVPEPVNFKRTRWFSNPNFRGSYSFKSVDTDFFNTTNKYLAEPLYNSNTKPVVLFAGEATSSNHYSTVHGAIETGWREAQRLIDYYKN